MNSPKILRRNTRFGILLLCMMFSLSFLNEAPAQTYNCYIEKDELAKQVAFCVGYLEALSRDLKAGQGQAVDIGRKYEDRARMMKNMLIKKGDISQDELNTSVQDGKNAFRNDVVGGSKEIPYKSTYCAGYIVCLAR